MDNNTYEPHLLLHSWLRERENYSLSTNSGASEVPFQRWKLFKEAFAPEFVANAIRETATALGRPVKSCIDPFGGSGTTALTCQFLNVYPITMEVNPFLADLIESKLTTYNITALTNGVRRLFPKREPGGRRPTKNAFEGAPPTFVEPGVNGRYLFSKQVAGRLSQLRDRAKTIRDKPTRTLFLALLAANAVRHSNVLISGKGRRYRKNWTNREVTCAELDFSLSEAITNAVYDIRRYQNRAMRDYKLIRGDARILSSKIKQKVDMAVFSPPYPNSFDYTDVYNVELWVGGYLSSRDDNRALREATLRSHVQIKRDYSHKKLPSPLLAKTIKNLRAVESDLWNKSIPLMISAYFADMEKVLCSLHKILNDNGRIYMAVGDSRYAGVEIRVSEILAQLSKGLGFRTIQSKPFRSMRSSPQQGGKLELAETMLVLAK